MDNLLKSELEELKKFCDENNYDFFGILLVIEGVKSGVEFGEGESKFERMMNIIFKTKKRKKIIHLRNMLAWFGLNVSINKIGIYVTKSKSLSKQWAGTNFDKRRVLDRDADKFFGFPKCCVEAYCSGVSYLIQLYSLFKNIRSGRKSIEEFKAFWSNTGYIYHAPCSTDCQYSIEVNRSYGEVVQKYHWLLKDFLDRRTKSRPNQTIHWLHDLPQELKPLELEGKSRNTSFLRRFKINPDDLKEILEHGRPFIENLYFVETLLRE